MKLEFLLLSLFILVMTAAQAQKQDTVIISIAKTSKIIFTIQDRRDIEVLKHYNFQELFRDVLKKLETNDTTDFINSESVPQARETAEQTENDTTQLADIDRDDSTETDDNNDDRKYRLPDDDDDDDDDNYRRNRRNRDDWDIHFGTRRWGRTWQTVNFDLGTNNYLEDGSFPGSEELHTVRPWGSWYFAVASVQSTRLSKRFFLQWSVGFSWYNFKFENDDTKIIKTDDGIIFTRDNRDVDFIKSKLTASYLYASLIPLIDFGDNGVKHRFWEPKSSSFRIGAGPYIGYRVGSHVKQVYKDGGREKDKDRGSYHLNNLRYGGRLQIGYRSTDLFFNYDFNELFVKDKGPKLNAFSFGVIF